MVYFVGAGTGAADLITVRGMRLLEQADVIIYAGSLVNPELLAYAKKEGWDTMQKGLEGGIKILKSNYIDKKQNTLYLNKFNVNPVSSSALYGHQYMQNLSAAYSEARTLRSAYANTGTLKNSIKFVIPVYENMPSTPCASPAR